MKFSSVIFSVIFTGFLSNGFSQSFQASQNFNRNKQSKQSIAPKNGLYPKYRDMALSDAPTEYPSDAPTYTPSMFPTTSQPSVSLGPTVSPSYKPSPNPSMKPTGPTKIPTIAPSLPPNGFNNPPACITNESEIAYVNGMISATRTQHCCGSLAWITPLSLIRIKGGTKA